MALLWMDGFECYVATGALSNTLVSLRGYNTVANMNFTNQAAGRVNGNSLEITSGASATFQTPSLTTNDTIIFGFAVKLDSVAGLSPASRWILTMKNGATNGMSLRFTTGGEIAIWYGDPAYSVGEVSSGLALADDTWYYVEVKLKTNATTGSWEVRVNGTTVLNQTGKNTKQGGSNNYHDAILWQGVNNKCWIDDMYICDASGATHNDFLGNMMITPAFPSADNSVNWSTVEPAGDHYAAVDDGALSDGDTTYVEDATTGHKDLYEYGNISGLVGIQAVQMLTNVRVTGAESIDLKQVVKSNTTEDSGTATAITSTSYVLKTRMLLVDPDTTTAWTEAGLNAAQFGVEVG